MLIVFTSKQSPLEDVLLEKVTTLQVSALARYRAVYEHEIHSIVQGTGQSSATVSPTPLYLCRGLLSQMQMFPAAPTNTRGILT